jgi:hypothetical protein
MGLTGRHLNQGEAGAIGRGRGPKPRPGELTGQRIAGGRFPGHRYFMSAIAPSVSLLIRPASTERDFASCFHTFIGVLGGQRPGSISEACPTALSLGHAARHPG